VTRPRPVTLPPEWAQRISGLPGEGGPTGADWVRRLPGMIEDLLQEWRLQPTGDPLTGWTAIVVPVQRHDGSAAMLKICWPHRESAGEHLALRRWAGDGAVRLLAAEPARGALLLEALDPARDLEPVRVDEACEVLGGLLRRLHVPALPQLLRLPDHLALELDQVHADPTTVPRRYLDQATAQLRELSQDPSCEATLIHTDLHFTNVLHRLDGWVAIDPKPMAGHPGYELMPVLRNRTDEYGTGSAVRHLVRRRLEIVCESAGIDLEAAKAWTAIAGLLDIHWNVTSGDEASASLAVAVLKALGD
jgi:streptomycin 6-kinase